MEIYDENVNYYDVLGVSKKASLKEIHSAYKKKSLIHHPDRDRGKRNMSPHERLEQQEIFSLISKAYKVLSNSATRESYDNDRAATFDVLRSNFRETVSEFDRGAPEPELDPYDPNFQNSFNHVFEKKKTPDPNDIGAGDYGDVLAPRRSISEGISYVSTDVPAPDNIFRNTDFDNAKFNKLFNYFNGEGGSRGNTSIVHVVPENGPEPANGDLVEGTDIGTAVKSYNGLLIVGEERKSFDSVSGSDYLGAFGKRNPTLDDLHEIDENRLEHAQDSKLSVNDTSKLLQARQSERGAKVLPLQTEQESMAEYMRKKEERILKDREKNKDFVKKYSVQFSDYLGAADPNSM